MAQSAASLTDSGLGVYVPADRRRAIVAGVDLVDRGPGAALFADISGFTPLTEALVEAYGTLRGAEELTAVLDRVLGAMIDHVEAGGGAVVYFSGDAITVWFPSDDGRRAVLCADAMQHVVAVGGEVAVGDTTTRLGLKVAVATGHARRFVVGDADLQLIDVLAGAPLDEVAAAEGHAEPGQVVVTRATSQAIGARADGAVALDGAGQFLLLSPSRDAYVQLTDVHPPPVLDDDRAGPWVLPEVRERVGSGDGGMAAELRRVVPMFVRFAGVDFEADDAPDRVGAFVNGVQRIFAQHGGSMLQLTVGDKGAYLYGAFGALVAHEDDPARAVAAGLAVQRLAEEQGVHGVQVGISRGRVFSGVHGHVHRRTFVCLGDPVNLSARVMGQAGPGEVIVTPEIRAAVGGATFESLPPVTLKGKAHPVHLSRVVSLVGAGEAAGQDGAPLLDREFDVAMLLALAGGGAARLRTAAVVAEAGLGKTRLVREVVATLEERGARVLRGVALPYGRTAPYQLWRDVWWTLLGLSDSSDVEAALTASVGGVDEALLPRLPLLGRVLGVEFADTQVTAGMDARVRRASREDLLLTLLGALGGPEDVIVLEDAHDADELSLELVNAVARRAPGFRGLLLVVGRPFDGTVGGGDLAAIDGLDAVVRPGPLTPEALSLLVDHHVALRFVPGTVLHPTVRALVIERGQGNPLAVAELVRALEGAGVDPSSPDAADVDLPAGLEALVLGRVDRLPDRARRTLKVASVMLRPFSAATLHEVHPDLGDLDQIEAALVSLVGELLERRVDARYELRHALTREVAYGSLPFGLRGTLHEAAGRRVEREHADALGPELELLAHHFWHGTSSDRRENYQRLAAAAATEAYANEAALTYLERLIEVTQDGARVRALLDRGEVLALVGRTTDARAAQEAAAGLAATIGDEDGVAATGAALAETARRDGRFDEALDLLARADVAYAGLEDVAGRAQVLHLRGTIEAQRGELGAARDDYVAALAIRDGLGDDAGRARLLSNLGIVAAYGEDLAEARSLHERALAIREDLGDPWTIANSRTNLGMIALLEGRPQDARASFDAALAGNSEVGDPWMVALSHHNLGNALRDLGELAGAVAAYAEAADHFVEQEDDWALAQLLEDGAELAVAAGRPGTAVELVGGADRLRTALDAPRAPNVAATIERVLATATTALGEDGVAAARGVGADRGRRASVAALLAVVGVMAADA